MKDWEILSESELAHLEQSSGDDCDMAAVRCAVRELRARRAADRDLRRLSDVVRRFYNRYGYAPTSATMDLCDEIDKLLAGGGAR